LKKKPQAFSQMSEKVKSHFKRSTVFYAIYLAFFFFLPFIYYDKLVDPVLIPRQIFLTVFIVITASIITCLILFKKLPSDFLFLKSPFFLALLLFVAAIIISFCRSTAISESIYILSKVLIEIIFLIITTYLLIQNKLSLAQLTNAVIGFCLVVVFIACFQAVKYSYSDTGLFVNIQSIKATIANKNLFSSILFLVFPFLLYSIITDKSWRIAKITLLVVVLILVWITQTKAVILAFFVFIVVLLFIMLVFRKVRFNKSFITIASIVIALFLIIAYLTFKDQYRFAHIFSTNTAYTRFMVWENSVEMIKENFVFGVGAGNWQFQFPKYGLDQFTDSQIREGLTTFQRPHNDFLWVFCELGVVGFIPYISFFILILILTFKLFRRSKEKDGIWLYALLFAGIIGYLIIALVDFPLERIEHQIVLFSMFAIIIANYYKERNRKKHPPNKPAYLYVFIFIVSVILSTISGMKRFAGEFHSHKLYAAHHQANWSLMIREADKATSFFYTVDPMSTPIVWYKGVALFSTGKINVAKKSFEAASELHPNNIHVNNNLASCYESSGKHHKAIEYYMKALDISSGFEEALLNLAAVYYNMNDYRKAFETIDKCSIDSNDPKYTIFLPVILSFYIENIMINNKMKPSNNFISRIKSNNEEIIRIYFESKKNKIIFDKYIENHLMN